MMKWYVGYYARGAYRGKYVYAETAEKAIKKARVKDITELYNEIDMAKMGWGATSQTCNA